MVMNWLVQGTPTTKSSIQGTRLDKLDLQAGNLVAFRYEVDTILV